MRWVEGQLLNEIVRDNLDRPAVLNPLVQIWVRMGKRLRETGLAHADLQHGNVLFVPGSQKSSLAVKLIDYDGMFVPALDGKDSGEVGHPNYQHPARLREGTYSPEVDRFPLLVVAAALKALAEGGRALWDRYDNGDNLLFKESDLRAPEESALFKELGGLADPQGRALVDELRRAVGRKLGECPPLDELLPEAKPVTARVPARVPGQTAISLTPSARADASGPDMDFGDSERLATRIRKTKNTKKRSGVPVWAWAGGGAAAVVAVVVTLLLALGGGKTPDEDGGDALAQRRDDEKDGSAKPPPKIQDGSGSRRQPEQARETGPARSACASAMGIRIRVLRARPGQGVA
jgi:hypothetical protein